MLSLPKRWLIHDIEYKEYKGVDNWDNPIYRDEVTINNVRFDDSTVFSRDSSQNKIVAEAVIFVDIKNSNPIPKFVERSKIIFNNREYTLEKVIPLYYPTKNKIRHYELEVI